MILELFLDRFLEWLSPVFTAISAPDVQYAALIFGLFIIPKFLSKYRIPQPFTALGLGFLATFFGLPFGIDSTIQLLSTLGIVSLFLFAGLEVDFDELKRARSVLSIHLLIKLCIFISLGFASHYLLDLDYRASAILVLALFTPSGGFILDTLKSRGYNSDQQFWIRVKTIGTEIVALMILFVSIQAESWKSLGISFAVMMSMVLALPLFFKAFIRRILPYAPDSQFGFILLLAFFCSMITARLGAYYLIGAFIVGVASHRFEKEVPDLVSHEMFETVRRFSSFFIPFYFFREGSKIEITDFTIESLWIGLLFLVIALPLRLYPTILHRKTALWETTRDSRIIAMALLPNLVFGLVLARILNDVFQVSRGVFGGVIIYTLVVTLLPSFFSVDSDRKPAYGSDIY